MDKRFYITTAIPYVNAKPHLGFALESVQADIIARFHRTKGEDVFFLTGTDENALKNVLSAKEKGIEVKKLIDENAESFRNLKSLLNLSWDDFIRTTEKRHIEGAQKFWLACKKGDIYKKNYRGLYCVGCEEFKTEKDLLDGRCPEHPNIELEKVEEENYFFRLSAYQDRMAKLIESGELQILPENRKNEVLSFIRGGLEDFSISRSRARAEGCGIPVPDGDSQVMYVWFDALTNYITALGYANNSEKFTKYWKDNENIFHVIGKGIFRFHAIYWPAMLLSVGMRLPKGILIHGYIGMGGQKISKSLGNVVDPVEVVGKYGTDALRFWLAHDVPAFGDADFTWEKFKESYNANLANGLGNLVSRVMKMATTNGVRLSNEIQNEKTLNDNGYKLYCETLDEFEIQKTTTLIWTAISNTDKIIQKEEPFRVVKNNPNRAKKDIENLLKEIWVIGKFLAPIMPQTSEKILNAVKNNEEIKTPLFPRL